MSKYDFDFLAECLINDAIPFLRSWLPNGRLEGNEYKVGSLRGEAGKSLSINTKTGAWADFAEGVSGGDLISLYAAIYQISNVDAYKELSGSESRPDTKPKNKKHRVGIPPEGEYPITTGNEPTASYKYKTADDRLHFVINRYDTPSGKIFQPNTWDDDEQIWRRSMGDLKPRPLYLLQKLNDKPKASVVVVEGEKAADAAYSRLSKNLSVVTWPGGANAINHVDYSPLNGRNVLLWPDNDKPGLACMNKLAAILKPLCASVKILDVSHLGEKEDAHDYFILQDNSASDFIQMAKERATVYESASLHKIKPDTDEPDDTTEERIETKRHVRQQANLHNPQSMWETWGLRLSNKTPYANAYNVTLILNNHPDMVGRFRYDEFTHSIEYKCARDGWRELKESDITRVTIWMQDKISFTKITERVAKSGIIAVAEENTVDTAKDWLKSLEWDGVKRVEDFFHTYIGAKDDEYTQAVSRIFWVSMAARIMSPGAKVDTMVVVESQKQGIGKSTAMSIIGGDWYSEVTESPTSKDFYINMSGKIIMDVGEMHVFTRSDRSLVKQILSNTTDRYRSPWAAAATDHPRRCIFVGSTNDTTYLSDPTGNRRFFPIKAGNIKTKQIEKDREQLFAEALDMFYRGVDWWTYPEDMAERERESRRVGDPWESLILTYLSSGSATNENGGITESQIIFECLGITAKDRVTTHVQARVRNCLVALGWEIGSRFVDGTYAGREWVRKRR